MGDDEPSTIDFVQHDRLIPIALISTVNGFEQSTASYCNFPSMLAPRSTMSYSISTLLLRNLSDVFGENEAPNDDQILAATGTSLQQSENYAQPRSLSARPAFHTLVMCAILSPSNCIM